MRTKDQNIRTLASILTTNAVFYDDPRTTGATDCYLVSLDDMEALRAALTSKEPDAESWLRLWSPASKRALEVALAGDHTVTVIGHPENGADDFAAIMFDALAFVKPCPCGGWNDPIRECTCSPAAIHRYRKTKDYQEAIRAEIIIIQPSPRARDLLEDQSIREPLADCLVRVRGAKEFADHTCMNRDAIDGDSTTLLERAIQRLGFTAQQVEAIKRVARTIADLERALSTTSAHVAEAIHYQTALKEIEA